MRSTGLIISFLLAMFVANAQPVFHTEVPNTPVVAGGDPFRVQYVLEDVSEDGEFFQPDFTGFHFVNGPTLETGITYSNGSSKKIKNIIYTLVALKPGKCIIPGASIKLDGKIYKSANVVLEVLSKAQAFNMAVQVGGQQANQDYYLRPGEDPQQKIRKNLFIKVQVDKRSCYVGEPITAVFKLYSRLESKSDIVKNPGFYGFTVQDMMGMNEQLVATETINGKKFDVHTVRKVQLYPLQAGLFTVDPMEVVNKVEFSRSAVNRKPEQSIEEGIFPEDDFPRLMNTEVFESNMSTEAVAINVKALPIPNQPQSFAGATGHFAISAAVDKTLLNRNEEGSLTLTIKGKGNFTQLAPPVINWPEGIEGFEPSTTDSLDNTKAPIIGSRVFHYRFVSARAGAYTLPAVSFSFFDPDSNSYKIISTRDTSINIGKAEKHAEEPKAAKTSVSGNGKIHFGWWLAAVFVLAGIIALAFYLFSVKKTAPAPAASRMESVPQHYDIDKLLEPAYLSLREEGKWFYTSLRRSIWDFFTPYFGLSGSEMNKFKLLNKMKEKNISEELQRQAIDILDTCEAGMFTSIDAEADKGNLFRETKQLLESMVSGKK